MLTEEIKHKLKTQDLKRDAMSLLERKLAYIPENLEGNRIEIKPENKLVYAVQNDNGFLDEFYFCDSIFSYPKSQLSGCTGFTLVPVSRAQYDEIYELSWAKERFYEHWQQAVACSNTEEGLECFVEELMESCDYVDSCFDLSHFHNAEEIRDALPEIYNEKDYPYFECISGGRIFSRENVIPDIIFNQELYNLIQRYEES